jgi:hypothetical protein
MLLKSGRPQSVRIVPALIVVLLAWLTGLSRVGAAPVDVMAAMDHLSIAITEPNRLQDMLPARVPAEGRHDRIVHVVVDEKRIVPLERSP